MRDVSLISCAARNCFNCCATNSRPVVLSPPLAALSLQHKMRRGFVEGSKSQPLIKRHRAGIDLHHVETNRQVHLCALVEDQRHAAGADSKSLMFGCQKELVELDEVLGEIEGHDAARDTVQIDDTVVVCGEPSVVLTALMVFIPAGVLFDLRPESNGQNVEREFAIGCGGALQFQLARSVAQNGCQRTRQSVDPIAPGGFCSWNRFSKFS